MRGTWIVAGALAALAGCPTGEVGPEQPDATPADGVVGDGGLTITFTTTQAVPGAVAPGLTLDDVRMHADTVRAIGDAAPGDALTTRNDYELRWHDQDTPEPIRFERAPAGLYSTVELRLAAGAEYAYEIDGEVMLGAITYPFEIETDEPLTITAAIATTLPPGGSATVEISVDLAAIVQSIDFSAHPIEDGKIEVDGDDSAVQAAIRAALQAAPAE
jgi:hypothetical protein